MISAWTKHIKDEQVKERFKTTVLHSKPTLERLQQMLDEMEMDLTRAELDKRIYDTPNWDYKIAHDNGFLDCLKKVKRIINLDQEETKNEQSVRPADGNGLPS